MPGLFRRTRYWLSVVVVAALSCGDSESDTHESVASLELGTGVERFEPLERGQHAKLYAGNQGGHHVWLSFRARGLASEEVRMVLDVTPPPPSMPSHWDLPISLEAAAIEDEDSSEPVFEFIGWPAQVLQPECAVGSPVELALLLEDKAGVRVRASTEVVADAPDEGFRRACAGR